MALPAHYLGQFRALVASTAVLSPVPEESAPSNPFELPSPTESSSSRTTSSRSSIDSESEGERQPSPDEVAQHRARSVDLDAQSLRKRAEASEKENPGRFLYLRHRSNARRGGVEYV